jgi:hypothetical protein
VQCECVLANMEGRDWKEPVGTTLERAGGYHLVEHETAGPFGWNRKRTFYLMRLLHGLCLPSHSRGVIPSPLTG